MITVSTEMVFRSVLFSALSGMIFGFLRSALLCLVNVIYRSIARKSKPGKVSALNGGFLRHSVDFLLVFALGVIYLLSGYVFLDGAYEIYSFSVLILSSVLFNRLFLRIFVSSLPGMH